METARYLDNIVWELTLKCNARCAHCGSAAGMDRKDNLSEVEIMRVCDELGDLKCRKVTLIGGETFLYPGWRKIVQKLRSLNIDVAIVTNALALDEEKIKFLEEQNLETLGISLDGAKAETHDSIRQVPGTFKHIFSLSGYLKSSSIPVTAITTVTKKNILELPELMALLPNTFFSCWQLQIGTPFGRQKNEMTINGLEFYIIGLFLALMQCRYKNKYVITGMHDFGYYSKIIPNTVNICKKNWHGCPAGHFIMGLRSNGKVLGCLSIYDDRYIEGDLRQNSLKEIWKNKNFCLWNQRYNKYKGLRGACRDCMYAVACCAGCSGSAIAQNGNENSLDLCFHKLEQEYENYTGKDAYGRLMRELTNGSITEDGYFKFKDGSLLDKNSPFNVEDEYLQNLLNILK